jgi:hypothetical protein
MPIWYGQTTGGRKSKNQQVIAEPESEEEQTEPVIRHVETIKTPPGMKMGVLIDLKEFHVMAEADAYLGHKKGYLHSRIARTKQVHFELDGHDIEVIYVPRDNVQPRHPRMICEVDGRKFRSMKAAEEELGMTRGTIRRVRRMFENAKEFPIGRHRVKFYN